MKTKSAHDVNKRWRRILQAHEQEQTGVVLVRCRELLAMEPDHCATLIVQGISFTRMFRYAEAQAALTKALTLVPKRRRFLVMWYLGHLEEARGNYRLAMKWHRKSARLRPDDASSWIYCGHIAFSQGRLRQGEAFNRRALKCKEGRFDEAWFNLGGALLAQDRLEEARACYLKAIAIDPKYGIAKKRLKDVELAIAERALTSPKPSHPRRSRRVAARTPASAVRARTRGP